MRLAKLANWLSEGDLKKYQEKAQRASTAQAQLQQMESQLEELKTNFQQVQKELAQTKAQLQINQGFQIELGETQLKLQQVNAEAQRYKKELFEQQKQLNLAESQLAQARQALARTQDWTQYIQTPVRVAKIKKTLPKENFDTLWGFGIITPKAESVTTTGALLVKGWVLGKKAQAKTLKVKHQSEEILSTPVELLRSKVVGQYPDIPTANQCGFEFSLSVVGIPSMVELSLEAVLTDESTVPLCAIIVQTELIESKDT
ncbi:hypothetical protein I4641_19805 [Waterburya agarophytonicola K14]|uniref:Uncharacterized protein n=1 Tax=Waterburya agarophytonicola KI4 TaxID=2874699 RepID=A0A964BV52_9CYAN|nr:hypothetical protein [Waterburya agarophytonicola]MCC0179212.1 hypothetical protein [Waterburya agarophytonicola KI4]